MTYSESKGHLPFDWNGFLERAASESASAFELAEAKDFCGHWITCACGNQCASLPRWPDGRPIDDIARALGNEFAIHIDSESWRLAKITLGQIEARTRELLSKVSN